VYEGVRGLSSFEPWLQRIRHFPESVIDEALRTMPPAWIAGDEAAFERLMEQLLKRRARVSDLIADARGLSSEPFPLWR
jgi:hypothetical protein